MNINQKEITIINISGPNIGAPKYINQVLTELKRKIDNIIIIVRTSIPYFQQ